MDVGLPASLHAAIGETYAELHRQLEGQPRHPPYTGGCRWGWAASSFPDTGVRLVCFCTVSGTAAQSQKEGEDDYNECIK